jgi:hypothetical protein
MKPSGHIIVSVSLGLGLWLFVKSLPAAFICAATGIFMDIDHAIDYLANFGWRGFSFKRCYDECVHDTVRKGKFRFKKLYMIFHAVELAIIFWLLAGYTKNIYIFALALGYFSHLVMDVIGNREVARRCFYFFSWRARHKFWTAKIIREEAVQKNPHLQVV